MPKGSYLSDRLRICGTRITGTKREPIESAPSQATPGGMSISSSLADPPRRCGPRITVTKREPIRFAPSP